MNASSRPHGQADAPTDRRTAKSTAERFQGEPHRDSSCSDQPISKHRRPAQPRPIPTRNTENAKNTKQARQAWIIDFDLLKRDLAFSFLRSRTSKGRRRRRLVTSDLSLTLSSFAQFRFLSCIPIGNRRCYSQPSTSTYTYTEREKREREYSS